MCVCCRVPRPHYLWQRLGQMLATLTLEKCPHLPVLSVTSHTLDHLISITQCYTVLTAVLCPSWQVLLSRLLWTYAVSSTHTRTHWSAVTHAHTGVQSHTRTLECSHTHTLECSHTRTHWSAVTHAHTAVQSHTHTLQCSHACIVQCSGIPLSHHYNNYLPR